MPNAVAAAAPAGGPAAGDGGGEADKLKADLEEAGGSVDLK
jgi:hypothetical protein